MKINLTFLFAVLVLAQTKTIAQQRPQYSQYMNNQFLLNPAVAGTGEQIDLKAGFRQQWAGINDAPRTFYVSGNMSLGQSSGRLLKGNYLSGKSGHGLGFIALKDQTGPLSTTSFNIAYAYRMQMTRDLMVSFGASGGFQQFLLDGSRLTYVDNVNAGIGTINNIRPDASIGAWLYSKNLFFGASIQQIIPGKFDGYNVSNNTNGPNQLARHYFVTTGYRIDLNDELTLIPSTMVKFLAPAKPSFDFNCKLKYLKKVWAGVSYRNSDGFTGLFGIDFKEMMSIAYAYDYVTSDIKAYQSGSHEIVLGFRIKPKGKFVSPNDSW